MQKYSYDKSAAKVFAEKYIFIDGHPRPYGRRMVRGPLSG